MPLGEIYDTIRNNFVYKTKLYFGFLTSEFHFEEPTYTYYEQSNGAIIADKFEFHNLNRNLKITVSNAYHPADYGFEINLTDLNTGIEETIQSVIKENQDLEQNYIEKSAAYLKIGFAHRLMRKH